MKPKPDEDTDQDRALFREAIAGVKPLAPTRRVASDAPKPRPRARFARDAQRELLQDILHGSPDEPDLQAGDASHFARAGVSEATLRKLRRGQYPVQAELDLHGLTLAEARVHLREFLIASLKRNAHCVRIVHGKGLRSGARGPVLRSLVNATLRRTQQVIAFTSARQIDGGTGAVYVLLQPPR